MKRIGAGLAQRPVATVKNTQAQRAVGKLEQYWLAHELNPAAQSKLLAPDFEHVLPGEIINRQVQLRYLRVHPDAFRARVGLRDRK
ncbi:MAG: hypothetical protein ACRD0Y_14460 [Terriglobales bacterium]